MSDTKTLLERIEGSTLPGKNPHELPLAVRARIALREQGAIAFAEGRYGDAEALAGLYRIIVSREFPDDYSDSWEKIGYDDHKGTRRVSSVFDLGIAQSFREILDAIRTDEVTRTGLVQ